jgi:hypothetical protein
VKQGFRISDISALVARWRTHQAARDLLDAREDGCRTPSKDRRSGGRDGRRRTQRPVPVTRTARNSRHHQRRGAGDGEPRGAFPTQRRRLRSATLLTRGRHLYDVHKLLNSPDAVAALKVLGPAGVARPWLDIDEHSETADFSYTPRPTTGYGASSLLDPDTPALKPLPRGLHQSDERRLRTATDRRTVPSNHPESSGTRLSETEALWPAPVVRAGVRQRVPDVRRARGVRR